MSAFARLVAVLAIVALASGCGDEDRVLTARCRAAPDGFVAAFSPRDAGDATIGGFSARQDELGTLFRVSADHAEGSGAQWTAVHTLTAHAANQSHEVYWNSQSLHVALETDLDGEKAAEPSRKRIESALLDGSGVVVWDVERQTIQNVVQAINGDAEALGILQRAAPEDRYLVISTRLLAREMGMFYTPGGGVWLADGHGSVSTPFVAIGTFRIDSTYYHTRFQCPAVDELTARAAETKQRVPAVYFYTAIRYVAEAKQVERDPRLVDFRLLTAEMQVTQSTR